MKGIPTFIKEKEEQWDKRPEVLAMIDFGGSKSAELLKSLQTQSLKESYALGIERAIEVAEGMKREVTDCQHTPSDSCDSSCASQYRDMTINESIPYFVTVLQKELSSIGDNS